MIPRRNTSAMKVPLHISVTLWPKSATNEEYGFTYPVVNFHGVKKKVVWLYYPCLQGRLKVIWGPNYLEGHVGVNHIINHHSITTICCCIHDHVKSMKVNINTFR